MKYNPDIPGEWKVHVTCDGQHIPGSIFHVTVLDAISLGGEGKVSIKEIIKREGEDGRGEGEGRERDEKEREN